MGKDWFSGAKIGGSGARFEVTLALVEASGIKIEPLRSRLGAMGPISGHLGLRLVALGFRLGAIGPSLEALRQRSWAPGPIVGALGSRFGALRPRFGALGTTSEALEPRAWGHDWGCLGRDWELWGPD